VLFDPPAVVGRGRRVGQGQALGVVGRVITLIFGRRQFSVRSQIAVLHATQLIRPRLGGAVGQTSVQPWCNFIQLNFVSQI